MLSENFVRPDEANKAQSFVREKGQHTLIDKVKVRYLSDDDKYWRNSSDLGTIRHIPDRYVREYDRLLMGASGRKCPYATSTTRLRRAREAPSGLKS